MYRPVLGVSDGMMGLRMLYKAKLPSTVSTTSGIKLEIPIALCC